MHRSASRLGIAALGLVFVLGAIPAEAEIKDYPITFGPTNTEWLLDGDEAGPFVPQGLGIDTDTHFYTIDSAGVLLVNGAAFDPPQLDVAEPGTTVATASQRFGDLVVTAYLRAYEYSARNVDAIAFIYSIKNKSRQRAQALELQFGGRRLSGADTFIYRTTDGNTSLDTNEAWMISQDSAVNPRGLVFALGTRGALTGVGNSPAGDTCRTFITKIKPRKTKRFAFFVAVDPYDDPEVPAATFNDKAALLKAGHLRSNLTLANW